MPASACSSSVRNCKVNARFHTGGGCCDRSECSQELGNCLLQPYRKPAEELSDAEAKVLVCVERPKGGQVDDGMSANPTPVQSLPPSLVQGLLKNAPDTARAVQAAAVEALKVRRGGRRCPRLCTANVLDVAQGRGGDLAAALWGSRELVAPVMGAMPPCARVWEPASSKGAGPVKESAQAEGTSAMVDSASSLHVAAAKDHIGDLVHAEDSCPPLEWVLDSTVEQRMA
jgi:hypothetical protein